MTSPRTALISLLAPLTLLAACSQPVETEAPTARRVLVETVATSNPQSRFEFVGRVEARISVDLAFQVGGQLAELPLAEGQRINAGDLVAQLDLEDFRRAEREARVQLQQARTDLERQQTLFERGIASQAALDSAQTQYDLRSVALETASRNLEYATLTAPFDGLVSRRLVDAFTVVSPGQPVARIQDVSELRLSIPVSEDMVATLSAEDLISVSAAFPFLPDQRFPLEFREMVAEPDNASQTYHAILALPDNLPANILPGMTATVFAEFDRDNGGASEILVPIRAITYTADGSPFVWVFVEDHVERRPVETNGVHGESVTILAGLAEGDQIVTAGVNALIDGMAVRAIEGDHARFGQTR